ncbi:hypothetical protein CEXT_786671 [Caerostris extrusa]|uniref:Uncharacterized protein n=1 Tax=Caerostris extrusa TaxID=172846 RepID=A0AAV4XDJ3_CAEEX|nr:hypothetical protein CEXT_786671 [Caerostris extrusa]
MFRLRLFAQNSISGLPGTYIPGELLEEFQRHFDSLPRISTCTQMNRHNFVEEFSVEKRNTKFKGIIMENCEENSETHLTGSMSWPLLCENE